MKLQFEKTGRTYLRVGDDYLPSLFLDQKDNTLSIYEDNDI